MSQILNIIKYKFIGFIKLNTDLRLENLIKNSGSFFVYAAFALGVYFFTGNIIEYLIEKIKIGTFLLHRFISIVLFIFFVAVNVGNIVVSFSTLYKSKEVFYLLTKPVQFVKIFLMKFLDNFFYSSTTLLMICLAVLAGYGNYFNINFWFYPFALVFILIPFMLTAASLGALILMSVIAIAKKIGVRTVIGIIGGLYLSGVLFFFTFTNPVDLVNNVMEHYPNVNFYYGYLDSEISKYLPNHWIADSLYYLTNGNLSAFINNILLINIFAVALFTVTLITSSFLYYKTWVVSLELRIRKEKPLQQQKGFFAFGKESKYSSVNESILKKEFWTFVKEPSQIIHASVLFLLIILFVGSIGSIDVRLFAGSNIYLRTVIYLVIFLFNAFLISSLSLRFVFPLLSLEGEAFWKIRSSPVTSFKLMSLKLIIYLTVIVLVSQILGYFSHRHFTIGIYIAAIINYFFISVTLVSLNFSSGIFFVNFKEKNPIRIASSQGASLTFLISLVYLIFLIIILFAPIYNYFEYDTFYNGSFIKHLLKPTLIISAVSIVITSVSLVSGFKRMEKDL